MFDIGFSELMVIAVVALLVIGPERLPKAARTLGHLFGRMQRYVNDVKADISREMELDELRKLQASMEDAARSVERSVSKELSETECYLRKITSEEPSCAAPSEAQATNAAPRSDQMELKLEAPPAAERRPT
jgi:sec-independent protein translocase protein TatB